jgi:hypothetical protein
MGGGAAPVKSRNVESWPATSTQYLISCDIPSKSCALRRGIILPKFGFGCTYLTKTAQKPKPEAPETDLYPELAESPRGPAEAASFIAETVNDLAWLAGRHKLDLLCYLLSMTQLEAEELAERHRSKKKPS